MTRDLSNCRATLFFISQSESRSQREAQALWWYKNMSQAGLNVAKQKIILWEENLDVASHNKTQIYVYCSLNGCRE